MADQITYDVIILIVVLFYCCAVSYLVHSRIHTGALPYKCSGTYIALLLFFFCLYEQLNPTLCAFRSRMRKRFSLQGQPALAQVPGRVGEAAGRADPEINAELIDSTAAVVDSHIDDGCQRDDHADHKRL